ncbi:major capsid protein [Neptunomonas japonica]|uniref:major capsid protein n=1 Tax=Neptunomonas japonica TaxID=417574 RepID=UPI0004111447|nr:major capsid protein [Neptunomonas japonica]
MNMKLAGLGRQGWKKVAVASVIVTPLVTQVAHAALDAAVTTQVATTSADITEAGTLLVGLAVVAMGMRWLKATFF